MTTGINCMVAGRKRFIFFPPDQLPNLYIGPLNLAPGEQPTSLVKVCQRFGETRESLQGRCQMYDHYVFQTRVNPVPYLPPIRRGMLGNMSAGSWVAASTSRGRINIRDAQAPLVVM